MSLDKLQQVGMRPAPGFRQSLPPLSSKVDVHLALTRQHAIQRQLFQLKWIGVAALGIALAALAAGVYASFFRTDFPNLTTGHLRVEADNSYSEAIRVEMPGGQTHFQNGMTGLRVNMPSGTSLKSTKQTGVLVTGGEAGFVSNGPFHSGLSVLSPDANGAAINVTNGIPDRLFLSDGANVLAS